MSVHLPLLLLHLLFSLPRAIIISAPDACGGTRVITHATALFGPRLTSSTINHASLFAPRPQSAGSYIRLPPSPPLRTPPALPSLSSLTSGHWLLATLFSNHARPLRHSGIFASAVPLQTVTPTASPSASPASPPPLPRPLSPYLSPLLSISLQFSPTRRSSPTSPADPPPGPSPSLNHSDSHESSTSSVERSRVSTPALPLLFNACLPLSVPADISHMNGRVAVITRGECDFAIKVLHMQDAGAVAVMVINFEDDGKYLANMKLNKTKKLSSPIRIPSVMISFNDWRTISPCRANTTVVFTPEGEATFDINHGREALNWAMMRGMALWILCQCGVNVVRYKRRVSEFRARADAIAALPVDTYSRPQISRHSEDVFRRANAQGDGENETVVESDHVEDAERAELLVREDGVTVSSSRQTSLPLPPSSETISSASASTAPSNSTGLSGASSSAMEATSSASAAAPGEEVTGSESEESVCAICLEDFEEGDEVRVLACSHVYHRLCIDPWLQSSSNCCPLCKREIPNLPPPPSHLHYGSMTV